MALADSLAPPSRDAGKSALQVCVFVAASVAVAGGLWGILTAVGHETSLASNHERYLSGLLLGVGIAFWSTLPDIERKADRFGLLASIVVGGGLCRLAGLAMGDALSTWTVVALIMELVVTPGLWRWLRRFACEAPGGV